MNSEKYVAIVDDHTMVRKGLISLINLFPNYQVLFDAANGSEFIRGLDPDRLPDIVLLDIAMPEMDGYATAEWLTANHPGVKILALSTMDTESAIIRMIRNGAKGYVLKDAEPAELKKAFDEVLSLGYYYNDIVSRKIMQTVHLLVEEKRNPVSLVTFSDRELTFLKLTCSEKTYAEIAAEMFVSQRTVDGYRDSLFKKLNVTSRVGLVLYAIRNGLVRV
jgi:DNA-binding NarL/FixJ family response regulator